MIRFFQQLGCYTGIPLIPSNDILTAEDCRILVNGREGLDSNTNIQGSHSFRNLIRGTIHSKLSSKSVTPQDSSSGPVNQSLPSNSQAIEQSIGATLQDTHHSSTSTSARIVTIDQQNVNSQGTRNIGPGRHPDRPTTRITTMLENAHNFSIENAPITNIGHQHVYGHVNYGLDILKEFVAFSALHDSSAQDPERCCHPGTRKDVLHKIRTWMDDPNAPERILWLNGPAGVGKSAIAQTISYSFGRDKIGASFFFFRSDPTRNDGNRLFPTLAWRLASSVPVVKGRIAFSLEEDPDLPREAIEAQFDQLIAKPFLAISGGESAAPTSTRVIIIDGLDECSDVKLQRRILKIIGNAIANTRFPLRFVISSRSEAHIEDFFAQINQSTLQINLANVDGAYRDIETYLISEFARIAVEQELDSEAWPGQEIIDTLVSQSSGQFVYASTIIKYAGDEYESAVTQLNVILGLKSWTGKSPFAELDALYTEILQRQPDQDFLKEFLAILVVCSALSQKNLHEDYAMLLGLDKKELDRKLRGMPSLLKSKPFIEVHHKSFLDFLQDSSRSSEYYVSKHFANRRYMEMITDLLVKAASRAMEQPDFHKGDHFQPRFGRVISHIPLEIELPLNDLEELLRPLQTIQENLLQLPNMSVPWKPRACDECWTFYMIDDLLLHLRCFQGAIQLREPKYIDIHPLTAIEQRQNIPQLGLDACLSSLLANLKGVESQLSLNVDAIGLVRALIRFDPTETAMKVRSVTDAQNLVELIFCLNKKGCFKSWFGATAHNATRLALAIYGRVPLLPRSLFLNSADLDRDKETYQGKAVKIWRCHNSIWRDCFNAFMCGNLSHDSIVPCLGICFRERIVMISRSPEDEILSEWWRNQKRSVSKAQQTLFEVAKAIQYIHSFGVTLNYLFDEDAVYLDADNHAKVQFSSFCLHACKGRFDYDGIGKSSILEDNIHWLGRLFYRAVFNKRGYPSEHRPGEPEIPDNVWQLMQWCCADDPKERPMIDQVVQEMESCITLGQFTLSS